jgi:protein SCO1/2
MSLSTLRLALWIAVGVAVFVFGAVSVWQAVDPTRAPRTEVARGGLIQPSNEIGGPFSLVDGDGRPVSERDFLGHPTAMFFGFTHCPDVCPTTLAEAASWLETLGDTARDLRFVFVSVDPERDTPEVLKNYIAAFDSRISGLTGSREQTDAVIKAFRVYARKVPLEGGDYTMDHTAGVYLMNRDMKFVGVINYQEASDKALAKLRALIAS